jgi:hypothetical protein
MVEQLVIDESTHEAVEEMYFWPAVREKRLTGTKLADTAIGQEKEGKEVLGKLDKLEVSDARFEKLAARFIEVGHTHISYEETEVLAVAAECLVCPGGQRDRTKIEQGKKPPRPACTRLPPPSPGVLKSAGPSAAAADRARDMATGRGE